VPQVEIVLGFFKVLSAMLKDLLAMSMDGATFLRRPSE
jgi:hypothetical protein